MSAGHYSGQSVKDFNAGDFEGGYKNAVTGLSTNDGCGNDDIKLFNQGMLLGDKALNERHLSEGDSRTDLNQAITVLSECQTTPGLYGTEVGEQCETAEENLISYKVQWDMGN
jgi:hypothetical protein